MTKIDEFKSFVTKHPELIKFVNNGKTSWQKFYEMYDLYGESANAWNEYINLEDNATLDDRAFDLSTLPKILKNIDMNTIQKHIGTAQKAINLFQEFATKGASNSASTIGKIKGPTAPRPINKFFED